MTFPAKVIRKKGKFSGAILTGNEQVIQFGSHQSNDPSLADMPIVAYTQFNDLNQGYRFC
jgi:hypothetical protein